MTLHEAIVQVLLENKGIMTTKEIADTLNQNNYYSKKDGSPIIAYQIHGRTKNYSHLFNRDGTLVTLKSKTGHISKPPKKVKAPLSKVKKEGSEINAIADLLDLKNFKSTSNIESKVPDKPGLYCIRIANPSLLKHSLSKVLQQRNNNIIYIGMASKSLKVRFLGQELRAKGHGSFFRSLGAILGYTPEKGSLVGKKNQQNYKFPKSHEAEIIDWINNNLLVNWVECENDLQHKEEALIAKYLPLFNISKNPGVLKEVIEARNNCKLIARNS